MVSITCYDAAEAPLKHMYQWDAGQIIKISGIDTNLNVGVNFCHIDSDEALTVEHSADGDYIVAHIPNILLQRAAPIMVYICQHSDNYSSRTIGCARIVVVPRAKPSDYIYTESEVLTYRTLDAQMVEMRDNLIAFEDKIPQTLPSPAKLIFDGSIHAEYDGSEETVINIPDCIIRPDVAEVGQTIVVKSVDENGKPTEWEAKTDYPAFADPDSWELINTVTVAAEDEVWRLVINADSDGNKFTYDELFIDAIAVAATASSAAKIFINNCAAKNHGHTSFNGFFVTNAQNSGKLHVRFLMHKSSGGGWTYMTQARTQTGAMGEFISSPRDSDGNYRFASEYLLPKMYSFGIQTSGETVFMSGTFTLYGRNYK